MPHQAKRSDVRREWLLAVLRLIADDLDPEDFPVSLSVTTHDDHGLVIVRQVDMISMAVRKWAITDMDLFNDAVQKGSVQIGS